MARLPRLTVPGYPHHLIQRGNNRQPIVSDMHDYQVLHQLMAEQARAAGVEVHAYVIVDTGFHLLATPREPDSLARMMQGIGRRYVRLYNTRTGRTGTLWEGRYRCALLQPEKYLLACMAELDLIPVHAGLADAPSGWAGSSHRHYIGLGADRLVTPHPLYWQLGNTPFAREQAYAERVAQDLPGPLRQALNDSALHGWALGDETFLAALQKQTGRRLTRARPGRPRTKRAD